MIQTTRMTQAGITNLGYFNQRFLWPLFMWYQKAGSIGQELCALEIHLSQTSKKTNFESA